MGTRPLDLLDFSGGLHLRRSEFALAHNQSPDMLNVDVDPKIGVLTRPGWMRWNEEDIIEEPDGASWVPRNAYIHATSDGDYIVYVSNDQDETRTVYYSTSEASFIDMRTDSAGFSCSAEPHLADFASWGDVCYIATGQSDPSYKKDGTDDAVPLAAPVGGGSSTFNDDYTLPAGGYMPKANLVETHLGYLFVAGIEEDSDGDASDEKYPNRLRWSHPNEPEDWAQLDYIDISDGGSRITALKSYRDALLIFKEDSIWALFGYDSSSWQLIQVSSSVGAPSPASVTRSPNSIYFYSGASRGGIYGMSEIGSPVHISDPLEAALEDITEHHNTWLAWLDRRLWCCLPWDYETSGSGDSVFVFDPEVGDGAWVCYQPALGALTCLIDRSDIIANQAMGVIDGSSGAAAVMVLVAQDTAADQILAGETFIQTPFRARYRTGWQHLGWPDLQKAWLRPRFFVGSSVSDVSISLRTFRDYDESEPKNEQLIEIEGAGTATWGSFVWGDGTVWAAGPRGSLITRTKTGSNLGWARSISMEFSTTEDGGGVPWAVSGVTCKVRSRMFTT